MKKKINVMLRKCKSLSKQLTLPSSYISSGSKSARHNQIGTGSIIWSTNAISVYNSSDINDIDVTGDTEEPKEQVYVGSTRKRYVISSKYLSHPLVNALVSKSVGGDNSNDENDHVLVINCEVVLFDHLLWMLENAEFNVGSECFDELAHLYSS